MTYVKLSQSLFSIHAYRSPTNNLVDLVASYCTGYNNLTIIYFIHTYILLVPQELYDVPRVLITGYPNHQYCGDFQFDQQLYEGLTKKKSNRRRKEAI